MGVAGQVKHTWSAEGGKRVCFFEKSRSEVGWGGVGLADRLAAPHQSLHPLLDQHHEVPTHRALDQSDTHETEIDQ